MWSERACENKTHSYCRQVVLHCLTVFGETELMKFDFKMHIHSYILCSVSVNLVVNNNYCMSCSVRFYIKIKKSNQTVTVSLGFWENP